MIIQNKIALLFILLVGAVGSLTLGMSAPATAATTKDITGTCGDNEFTAEYYDNQNLAEPLLQIDCVTTIDFNWGTGSPYNFIGPDHFSIRWSGYSYFDQAGTYRFSAGADDGFRVYVNSELIIDYWADQPVFQIRTADLYLDAGWHFIQVEYYENILNARATVSWEQADESPYDCSIISQIPTEECEALVALYVENDGPNWKDNTDWLQTVTPCSWHGITCEEIDSGKQNVTRLSLWGGNYGTNPGNGMKGKLSSKISDLSYLEQLDLSNNYLTELPQEIGSLSHLTHLVLHGNEIEVLPAEIGDLDRLVRLELDGNQLRTLPPEIGELGEIDIMFFQYNQLTSLPPEIGNLSTLGWLRLERNNLTSLPPEISNLNELEALDISYNGLTALPTEIAQLPLLRRLTLSDNYLNALPTSFYQLTSLTDLSLNRNQLQALPTNFGNLSNLQYVSLKGNQFDELPESIGNLANLKSLNLKSNRLNRLPASVDNLTNLTELDLNYNLLTTLPTDNENIIEAAGQWQATQTVAPDLKILSAQPNGDVLLEWTPIEFTGHGGYYEISYATHLSGPFIVAAITEDKSSYNHLVSHLQANTAYYFRIRTYTPSHEGDESNNLGIQPNELWSDYTAIKSVTTGDIELPPLYFSSSTGGTVDGVAFADEDILMYDQNTSHWALYFDGSDVGLRSKDVNAFHLLDNGNILLSLNAPITLSGVRYDDSDIIRFKPTSLGRRTRGTFNRYFDGSDVQLTTGSEDIDAFALLPDGDLLISTLGTARVTGVTARDEDLLRFEKTRLGNTTRGSWSLYLDGSDLKLNHKFEDIWAVWVDSEYEDVYLSTYKNFNATSHDINLRGDSDDIFFCLPISIGKKTECILHEFWDGDSHDLGNELIDGFSYGPMPAEVYPGVIQSAATDVEDAEEIELNDEQDDDLLDDYELADDVMDSYDPIDAEDEARQNEFSCTAVSEIPQLECEALVALYNGTDGPSWLNNSGWLVSNTPCTWYGVSCSGGNVAELRLTDEEEEESFGLVGAIPVEIGNLPNLTYLYLADNALDSVPAEIGNLTNLQMLDLYFNNVSTLPAEIGNLTNLQELLLHANGLSTMPTEIWALTNLRILDLGGNQLSTVPATIGNLSNLTELNFGYNTLNTLPEEIGNLVNLEYLYIGGNQLNTLPTSLVNLTELQGLDLCENQLQITDEAPIVWMNANASDWADCQNTATATASHRVYLPLINR